MRTYGLVACMVHAISSTRIRRSFLVTLLAFCGLQILNLATHDSTIDEVALALHYTLWKHANDDDFRAIDALLTRASQRLDLTTILNMAVLHHYGPNQRALEPKWNYSQEEYMGLIHVAHYTGLWAYRRQIRMDEVSVRVPWQQEKFIFGETIHGYIWAWGFS